MNFSNHFCESWNARFSGSSHYPQLDCLKADHFGSLLEQKQAIEFEESRRSAIIDELKQQLNHENFVVEFLHKCVQKLGAVSQVFNEIDQSDSKSTSSSGTTSRRPPSTGSPSPINGSVNNGNKFLPGSNSTFSLFPHCIASSLMQSASPLLAAAAATPSSPFLLSSTLSQFSGSDSMKLDPDTDPANGGRPSNFLLSAATERSSYDALSRLASQSSLYNTNNNNGATTNPFTNGSAFTSHQLRSQGHSIENRSRDDTPFSADYVNSLTSSSEAHAQAAAAVAAAFGLGFPSTVRSRNTSAGHLGMLQKSENESYQTSTSLHSSPPAGLNGRDTDPSVDRPYQCATCFRTFAVKAGLVQHMRTHTDERPYPCSHCGRAFKQKIQLTTHMRVHSGERPYGCRLCGKLFRQQSHVVQHLRTHTGEKPHKCYQCGKAFRQKYSLISHQRRMCRNRAASNPIAAGMTMWISPGAGGDTCNLVKEFSPARGSALTTTTNNNNNTASYSSPSNNGNYSIPTPAASTVQSPFSPYMNASPPVNSIGQKIVNNPDRSFPATATSNLPDGLTRVKMDASPCTPQQPEELPTQVDSEIEEDDEESVEDDDDCDDMENPTTQARNMCSSTTRSPRLPPPQNAAPLGLT